MLKIQNLSVKVNKRTILKKVDLKIRKGEIHAFLGPNASGKSSLARTIMGFNNYKITEGKIIFKGQDITSLPIEKRARLGIALVFQHPPTMRGVKLSKLLEKIGTRASKVKNLPITPSLLEREINVGFSGGEKKLSELVQVINLNPSFVILDELDSGLDIKNLERLILVIKNKLLKNGVSLLVITHRGHILRFLKPNIVHVMLKGKIICTSSDWKKIWKTIVRFNYEKCKKCELSPS